MEDIHKGVQIKDAIHKTSYNQSMKNEINTVYLFFQQKDLKSI